MISAELQGRRLILTVPADDTEQLIEPFIVTPLPMGIGRQLTADYINVSMGIGNVSPERKQEIFMIALDGGDLDTLGVRRDDDGNPITPQFQRAEAELSQAEGEELFIKAFMWQTIIGMDGITAFDDAGGGTAGALKAIRLLATRLGLLVSPTSPDTALGSQMQQAATPGTTTPPVGGALARLPRARRSRRQNEQ